MLDGLIVKLSFVHSYRAVTYRTLPCDRDPSSHEATLAVASID
jgi:hypothetical protein